MTEENLEKKAKHSKWRECMNHRSDRTRIFNEHICLEQSVAGDKLNKKRIQYGEGKKEDYVGCYDKRFKYIFLAKGKKSKFFQLGGRCMRSGNLISLALDGLKWRQDVEEKGNGDQVTAAAYLKQG